MRKKSCSLVDAMGLIKGSNIKYKTQYEQYWDANANTCLALKLPKYPMQAYKSDFPGWDAYLGNPEGTAVKTVREIHTSQANNTKFWKTGGRKLDAPKPAPKPVVAPVQTYASSISFESILETLHDEYNIPLDMLVEMSSQASKSSSVKIETMKATMRFLLKVAKENHPKQLV